MVSELDRIDITFVGGILIIRNTYKDKVFSRDLYFILNMIMMSTIVQPMTNRKFILNIC